MLVLETIWEQKNPSNAVQESYVSVDTIWVQ